MILLEGTCHRIAAVLGRSILTIVHYVDAFRQDGLAGLVADVCPGRVAQLTPEQEQQLVDVVMNQWPADVGFPAEMHGPEPLVRAWIAQQFNVSYTFHYQTKAFQDACRIITINGEHWVRSTSYNRLA